MVNSKIVTAVIFGGTGFVGSHFAEYLLSNKLVSKVILADIAPVRCKFASSLLSEQLRQEAIVYAHCDVRLPIELESQHEIGLIANFAAVHREPGHLAEEYYETNLLGAEHVCAWAETVKCENIIFTSSIAPYGLAEKEKTENSITVPVSHYGSSKAIAEKIHVGWLRAGGAERHLVIVRPGVVFGAGEGGNVTRLIKAVLGRYFVYTGNRSTRKAGVYVRELCNAMWWVLELQLSSSKNYSLFNMTMNPAPSVQEYVAGVCGVAGANRATITVPYSVLLIVSYVIDGAAKFFRFSHPFSPVRIRKLVRSNSIKPLFLIENGYSFKYSLKEALADWRIQCPNDW
jgi:nucleoside-diphosphate-sugar epimerase